METTILKVDGMTCSGCVRSVTNVLKGLPGVSAADVSLDKAQATINYDPSRVTVEAMRSAITDAGYEAR